MRFQHRFETFQRQFLILNVLRQWVPNNRSKDTEASRPDTMGLGLRHSQVASYSRPQVSLGTELPYRIIGTAAVCRTKMRVKFEKKRGWVQGVDLLRRFTDVLGSVDWDILGYIQFHTDIQQQQNYHYNWYFWKLRGYHSFIINIIFVYHQYHYSIKFHTPTKTSMTSDQPS